MGEPAYDPKAWDWMELAPDHPVRVFHVLKYIEAGAALGLGKTEWETIKAVLRTASQLSEP